MSELIIIAGFSVSDQPNLEKYLKAQIRKREILRFIDVSMKTLNYDIKKTNEFLSIMAGSFSKKTLPETIRLIYIPYPSCLCLVDSFFPFADIQSFAPDANYTEYVTSEFGNIEKCSEQLSAIIKQGLKQKLRPPKTHFSLLPIHNFLVSRNESFRNMLKQFHFSEITETQLLAQLTKNNAKHCYMDFRALLFLPTKQNEARLEYKNKMSGWYYFAGLYRFGRLWDPGFHHDVTHTTKPTLRGCEFMCSKNGKIICKNETHINVYLNDFIRSA